MAKKNDVFSYGSAAIPSAESKYSIIRWGWNGLNREDEIDSGSITDCAGVVVDPPYVMPTLMPESLSLFYDAEKEYADRIISIHGFGERLFVIYRENGKIMIDCLYQDKCVTGEIGDALGGYEDFVPRSMVQFNVLSNTENILNSTYTRKLLIFPDRVSMNLEVSSNFTTKYLGDTYPLLNLASVYGSRVFGVDDKLVYASAFNDYADWNLDTADEYNEANAWVSTSQSNVKADGKFTAIATYDNHVVLFKKDFMQLVYNNKNPFRIVDVGSWGCDNSNAVVECGGVLYFASASAVYAFAGGTPKKISDKLGIEDFKNCFMGEWRGTLYLGTNDGYVYTYKDGVWSSRGKVFVGASYNTLKQFATCDWGIVARTFRELVAIDWDENNGFMPVQTIPRDYNACGSSEWWFETDLMAAGKLDVRRVKKVSLLCDIEKDAYVKVYLLKDGEEFNANTSLLVGQTKGSGRVLLRCLTRMTSAYMHRLRIVGRGKVKIHAAEIQISWGGDVYVEG